MESVAGDEAARPPDDWQNASGGIRWRIDPGSEHLIRGPGAPDWFALQRDDRAALIKSNPRRRIWRVFQGEKTLIVKQFDEPAAEHLIRRIVRSTPAQREWRAAALAARRGVACPRFLALGLAGTGSVLIMHEIPGAVSLDQAWLGFEGDGPGGHRGRPGIIEAVARLVAHAHQRDFVHGDDHPRNILMSAESGGRLRAHYVDLQRARCRPPLSEEAVVGSLAQLHQWFRIRATATQRFRFLVAYTLMRCGDDRPAARRMRRRLTPPLLDKTHRLAAKLWAKRDRRIGTSNSYFAALESGGGAQAIVTLRFRQRDVYPAPSWPDMTAEAWKKLIEADRPGVPDGVIERRTVSEQCAGRSHAAQEQRLFHLFTKGHQLRNRDLPCRWPIACLRRAEGEDVVSYLWVDRYPGAVGILEYVEQKATDRWARRALAVELARLVRLLADRGVSITWISPRTLSVDRANGRVLIDEPADVAIRRRDVDRDRLISARALRDTLLDQFKLHRTDAAAFLVRLDRRHWKLLWRRIAADAPAHHVQRRSNHS